RIETSATGPLLAKGPLVAALQGPSHDLGKLGLSGTLRRVGFQAHDGRIFETLTARGGILVAVHSEPRAADALAVLHSYGGGNAALGACTGRVGARHELRYPFRASASRLIVFVRRPNLCDNKAEAFLLQLRP